MALTNQPYFPFYVNDWLSNDKLSQCEISTIGVYIYILCLMHKSSNYGKLKLVDKFKDDNTIDGFSRQISRQIPAEKNEIFLAISELISLEVIVLKGRELIKNRMVRDAEISRIRAESGSKKPNKQKPSKTLAKMKQIPEDENEDVNEVEYGNKDINDLTNYLKGKSNIKSLDGTVKQNRFDCSTLIKRMKKDYPDYDPIQSIKLLIDAGMNDKFHSKNLTTFKYLLNNGEKIKRTHIPTSADFARQVDNFDFSQFTGGDK